MVRKKTITKDSSIKNSTGRNVFLVCNTIFMLFVIFAMAYPMYFVVISSFSDPVRLAQHSGILWLPIKPFTLDAFRAILSHPLILSGFRNTFFVLIVGTSLNIIFTLLGAYFLSLKEPMFKDFVAVMIIFTMYFSGGLVPNYLNVKSFGLMDTLWALIIPGLISTTNLIIMKSAIQAVPDSLLESAFLDGANHLHVIFKIIVPLCKATLAVMVIYYGVGHWNAWFDASIYLRNNELFPIQLVARHFLVSTDSIGAGAELQRYNDLLKYALILIVSTPVILIYPFVQKYFTKGVMIGAVKG